MIRFIRVWAGVGTFPLRLGTASLILLIFPSISQLGAAPALPVISGLTDKTVNENRTTRITFTVSDADTALSSVVVTASSSNSALIPNANLVPGGTTGSRTLAVTPVTNSTGTSRISMFATDGSFTVSTSFVLTVRAINDAPSFVLTTATVTATEDTAASVPGVVASISTGGGGDEAGQTVTFVVTPANTAFFAEQPFLSASGTLKFRPALNKTGATTISVKAVDDGGVANGGTNASPAQTMTIQVNPVNDPAVLSGFANRSIKEDTVTPISFTVTDVDTALASVTISAVSSMLGVVPNENLTPTQTGSVRTLTVRPLSDAIGPTTITVNAYDGAATTSTSFVLTVLSINDAPTFSLTTATVAAWEDVPTTVPGFVTTSSTGGGDDESGQMISFKVTPANPALFAVQPVINGSGQLDFTLAPNVTTATSVAVQAIDNGGVANGGVNGSAIQTFTIQVNGANDPPVLTGLADKTINEDSIGLVVFKVTDVDTPLAGLTITASSSNVALVPNANLNPFGNSTNRILLVRPLTHANGRAAITLNVTDGVATSSASFVLTVLSVNDAPSFVLSGTTLSASEGELTTITNFAVSASVGGGADESALQVLFYWLTPANPTLFEKQPVINSSGSLSFLLRENLSVAGTTVSVRALDNGGVANGGTNGSPAQTFTIQITGSNDPPAILGLAPQTIKEDTVATVAFKVADVDSAVASVMVTASSSNEALVPNLNLTASGTSTDRTLNVRPLTHATGNATITVTASDGAASSSQMFVLTVLSVNDAPSFSLTTATIAAMEDTPTIVPNFVTTSSAGGGLDETGQVVVFKVVPLNPALFAIQPVINSSGQLNFTLAPNVSGSTTMTVQASDNGGTANGGGSDSPLQTVTITAAGLNDTPALMGLADKIVNEDSVTSIAFAVADVDTAVASIIVSASSSNATIIPNSNLVPGGNTASRTLAVRPATNANGNATITVSAYDGTGTTSSAFVLTVLPVNDAPTFALTVSTVTVTWNLAEQSVPNFVSAISEGPADEADQTVTFEVTPMVPSIFEIAPMITGAGTLTFKTTAGMTGNTAISVKAIDDGGTSLGGTNKSPAQTFTLVVSTSVGPVISAGDLDPAFGSNGKVTTSVGSGDDRGRVVAVQQDGRILVAGDTSNGGQSDIGLIRYNRDGSLDTTFGTNGKVTTDFGLQEFVSGIAVQADGRIIVGTSSGGDPFSVARYTAGGLLDASFGTGGKVTIDFGGNQSGNAIAVQADGKILVAGMSNSGSCCYYFVVMRFNANGSADTSFGTNGKVTTDFSGADDVATAIAVQPDGKIIVAGYASGTSGSGANSDFALARYESNGTLDTTFGGGGTGKATTDISGTDNIFAMALQSDGKILAAGRANGSGNSDFALARYTANGALDTGFGVAGKITADFGSSGDAVRAVVLQADGKIIAVGHTQSDFALIRYENNGTVDTSFGSSGRVTLDLGATDQAYAAARDSNDRIVVAGYSNTGGNYDFAVARFATGLLEQTLGLAGINSGKVEVLGVQSSQGGFEVLVQTVPGVTYFLEYKDSLTDREWKAMPGVMGNGTILRLRDSFPNSTQRFYRVRVQRGFGS